MRGMSVDFGGSWLLSRSVGLSTRTRWLFLARRSIPTKLFGSGGDLGEGDGGARRRAAGQRSSDRAGTVRSDDPLSEQLDVW